MISLRIKEYWSSIRQLIIWIALVLPVGMLSGSASAFFLWSLEQMTHLRWQYGWLLFFLPLAGVAIAWIYGRFGKSAEGGNNLVIDSIHEPGAGVPARMAPLVLLTTLMSHLFGGSVGREGTAIQMGGSLASLYARACKMGPARTQMLLMAGVAAGFGSVFGTPLAGAIFAMEVLVIGKIKYDALIPVLVASLVGDLTCSLWGIHHTLYHISFAESASLHPGIDLLLLGKVVLAAIAFGIVGQWFSELVHFFQGLLQKITENAMLRAAIGGAIVIALVYLFGTRDYLGLGVHSQFPDGVSLTSSFREGGAHTWSWALKLLFTTITLAAGFKGGEVTPLFFIGAALGNTLALLMGAPVDLFAGLGFIAVFSGATNTPLACTIMGIELFGSHFGLYFAVACFVAYYCSGHSSIYSSQRIGVSKNGDAVPAGISIKQARARRKPKK
ncbi:MAG: voltage-gated chloride channel family protein [Opitutales bacterium]|nr:voltage-gated chloride channel family protein [Opitutales bacterium]